MLGVGGFVWSCSWMFRGRKAVQNADKRNLIVARAISLLTFAVKIKTLHFVIESTCNITQVVVALSFYFTPIL